MRFEDILRRSNDRIDNQQSEMQQAKVPRSNLEEVRAVWKSTQFGTAEKAVSTLCDRMRFLVESYDFQPLIKSLFDEICPKNTFDLCRERHWTETEERKTETRHGLSRLLLGSKIVTTHMICEHADHEKIGEITLKEYLLNVPLRVGQFSSCDVVKDYRLNRTVMLLADGRYLPVEFSEEYKFHYQSLHPPFTLVDINFATLMRWVDAINCPDKVDERIGAFAEKALDHRKQIYKKFTADTEYTNSNTQDSGVRLSGLWIPNPLDENSMRKFVYQLLPLQRRIVEYETPELMVIRKAKAEQEVKNRLRLQGEKKMDEYCPINPYTRRPVSNGWDGWSGR